MNWNELIPTRRSLLSRIKHWDDQESWRDFFDTYWRLIYAAAISGGLSETEAEDVVQETIFAVARGIRKFRYQPEKCAFKTWLHAITKRQVANQFRKRQGKGHSLESLSEHVGDSEEVNEIPGPASESMDETWNREWEQNLLQAAIERVKLKVRPAQFQIYEHHVIQEHSTRETARTLGISIGKVYLAKHRIEKQLKRAVMQLRPKYESGMPENSSK